MIGRLDQHELAVGIDAAHDQAVDATRQLEQQRHNEPLVLDVVIEIRDAVQMAGQRICRSINGCTWVFGFETIGM